MVKSKKAAKSTPKASRVFEIPRAPWIYINDSSPGSYVTNDLIKLIPNSFLVTASYSQERSEYPRAGAEAEDALRCVNVFQGTITEEDSASEKDALQDVKTSALKAGANFVSVHVSDGLSRTSGKNDDFNIGSPNHLNISASCVAGKAIYDWLCKVPPPLCCTYANHDHSHCIDSLRDTVPHPRS